MTNAHLLLPLLALATPSATPSAAGGCGTAPGHCHVTRWEPDSPTNYERFGGAVSLDGSLAAVAGVVSSEVGVFERVDGVWQRIQTLLPPPGETSQGSSLHLEGERLFVGAHESHLGTPHTPYGAVFVYERTPGGLFEYTETLTPPVPDAGALFGDALEADGDWLVVGASFEDGLGAVHVFLHLQTGWEHVAKISGLAGGSFGAALSLRALPGEPAAELVVGSPYEDTIASIAGGVRFYRVTPGVVQPYAPLFPADLAALDSFGHDVVLTEEELFVSALGDDDADDRAGSVYVYDRVGETGFAFAKKLLPCDEPSEYDAVGEGAPPLHFGYSLAHDGERLVVGAAHQDVVGQPGGTAYVFEVDLFGSWAVADKLRPAAGVLRDAFGTSVAVDGDEVLVGARYADTGADESGAAYLFSLRPQQTSGACPCDVLADVESFGTGKPGSNGVPVLGTLSAPLPGTKHVIGLKNALVGASPVLVWGLIQGTSGFDGGELLIADPHIVPLPVVGVLGQVGVGWNVPDDPAACGLDLFAQAFFIDPGAAGPLHTAQSNGLRLSIGF